MKKEQEKKPTTTYDYLIKQGMDEQIALEIDEYTQQKEARKKRMKNKDQKENKWK